MAHHLFFYDDGRIERRGTGFSDAPRYHFLLEYDELDVFHRSPAAPPHASVRQRAFFRSEMRYLVGSDVGSWGRRTVDVVFYAETAEAEDRARKMASAMLALGEFIARLAD